MAASRAKPQVTSPDEFFGTHTGREPRSRADVSDRAGWPVHSPRSATSRTPEPERDNWSELVPRSAMTYDETMEYAVHHLEPA